MHHRAAILRSGHLPLVALLALAAATACGGDKGDTAGGDDGADPSGGGEGLVLTSSAFTQGGRIPVRHTCSGIDVSPPLAWTGGAAAAYALVLTDKTEHAVHSVLWDVPGDVGSLPEGIEEVPEPSVPAGAKQALAIDGETRGYYGPCPEERHAYEFTLHALDEYPLSGVTLDSTRDQLVDILVQRATARAKLVGTHQPAGW